ncbi:glycosyltransferase family 2 protein [Dapis sp. BLCC M126]|uniref:glycosyltransferase family 2 protein n=1 Tax=Dapis sp. BLCC M126 TaxID=3400189 RepID=UPI003CF55465
MDKKPLVSICIPTYNGAQFLEIALESALQQTYPSIEIIVSDDDSKDDTVKIVRAFQEKTPGKIAVFEHSRYGIAQNWNNTVTKAQGKYIKFLLQDDLLEPNCLEEMVDLAEEDEEIGMVFSPRELLMTEDSKSDRGCLDVYQHAQDVHKAWSQKLQRINSGHKLLGDPNFADSPMNKIGEPSNVLIRKEVFEEIGLFDSELHQTLDMDMWFRIMCKYKIGFIDKKLTKFRIHPKQASHKNLGLKNLIDNQFLRAKMLYSGEYEILNEGVREKWRKKIKSLVEHELEILWSSINNLNMEKGKLEISQQELQQEVEKLKNNRFVIDENYFENQEKYNLMVGSACYAYQTGDLVQMIDFFQQSLKYTNSLPTETLFNWVKSLKNFCELNGTYLDTYALTKSPEWEQLLKNVFQAGLILNK